MEEPSEEVLDHSRNELVAALIDRYRDQLPHNQITDITSSSWERLHDEARFGTYLPLITRRVAEDRIRRAIAHQ